MDDTSTVDISKDPGKLGSDAKKFPGTDFVMLFKKQLLQGIPFFIFQNKKISCPRLSAAR